MEKRGSVTYNTVREDEVGKIFNIPLYSYCVCVWRVQERILSMRNGFKFLKQVESNMSRPFKIVLKSLARFSTQFRVKESFKPLLAK